ncbi:hypothetical protein [Clostridium beijerinckii]|uniref:hypothetical protein n=1 Tax=Clostridium beijerinckii TaxID=1520 RepID=UPI00232F57E4|nr:hypothetical protein [Clostridium beijerinckii]
MTIERNNDIVNILNMEFNDYVELLVILKSAKRRLQEEIEDYKQDVHMQKYIPDVNIDLEKVNDLIKKLN